METSYSSISRSSLYIFQNSRAAVSMSSLEICGYSVRNENPDLISIYELEYLNVLLMCQL